MIRPATFDDVNQIVVLLEELHNISSMSPLDFSSVKAKQGVIAFIQLDQFVRVIEEEGKVVGVFSGLLTPTWFGNDSIAIDLSWYVHPDYRDWQGVALVEQFIEWAKERGAKQVRPGVSTANPNACRIYKALGFGEAGAGFYLDL